MTEKDLNKLYWLVMEREHLENELNYIKDKTTYKSPVLNCIGKKIGGFKGNSEFIVQMIDIENIIKDNLKEILKEITILEKYISTIEDSEMRFIMRLRHINGMKWEDIADKVNSERTTVSKKYKRFLKKSLLIS